MTHTITPMDLRMAKSAARKYRRAGETRHDADFESAALAGLYAASRRFDGRGVWHAFARMYIRTELAKVHARHVEPLHDHATTVAPADLPDTAAPAPHEITNDSLAACLDHLPGPEVIRLLDGDIDRRRPKDRALIDHMREHVGGIA